MTIGSAARIESPSTSDSRPKQPLDERGDSACQSAQTDARAWSAAAFGPASTPARPERRSVPVHHRPRACLPCPLYPVNPPPVSPNAQLRAAACEIGQGSPRRLGRSLECSFAFQPGLLVERSIKLLIRFAEGLAAPAHAPSGPSRTSCRAETRERRDRTRRP